MNKVSYCIFVLCCCAAVCFGRSRDAAYIVRPDLQKAVLGFEITPEEDQEFWLRSEKSKVWKIDCDNLQLRIRYLSGINRHPV